MPETVYCHDSKLDVINLLTICSRDKQFGVEYECSVHKDEPDNTCVLLTCCSSHEANSPTLYRLTQQQSLHPLYFRATHKLIYNSKFAENTQIKLIKMVLVLGRCSIVNHAYVIKPIL